MSTYSFSARVKNTMQVPCQKRNDATGKAPKPAPHTGCAHHACIAPCHSFEPGLITLVAKIEDRQQPRRVGRKPPKSAKKTGNQQHAGETKPHLSIGFAEKRRARDWRPQSQEPATRMRRDNAKRIIPAAWAVHHFSRIATERSPANSRKASRPSANPNPIFKYAERWLWHRNGPPPTRLRPP